MSMTRSVPDGEYIWDAIHGAVEDLRKMETGELCPFVSETEGA